MVLQLLRCYTFQLQHEPSSSAQSTLCSWRLVYAQQKVGLDSFNLYFKSNVMVNIPFASFGCVTLCSRACVVAGRPSCGDELQGLWMHTSERLLCLFLLAALLFRSWSVVTNNTSFSSPGAEGVLNTIMTSPWLCSGAGLSGLAGNDTWLGSQFASSLLLAGL